MSKKQNLIEYFIQEVNSPLSAKTLEIKRSLKEVVHFLISSKGKAKLEKYNEYQWYPYMRVVAYKPSGKIKILKFDSSKLN